jgi:hypothetical protein
MICYISVEKQIKTVPLGMVPCKEEVFSLFLLQAAIKYAELVLNHALCQMQRVGENDIAAIPSW